jgi:hypothetical protein
VRFRSFFFNEGVMELAVGSETIRRNIGELMQPGVQSVGRAKI